MEDSRPMIYLPDEPEVAFAKALQAGVIESSSNGIFDYGALHGGDGIRMKRDKGRLKDKHAMKRHIGEDPAKLLAEFSPGKKGGDMDLPFGGRISIQPGTFGKKDVVTCCMVSPSDRFKYQPPLGATESLCSEIFLLATSCTGLRKGHVLSMRLPHCRENLDVYELQLLVRRTEKEGWCPMDCKFNDADLMVEFEAEGGGIYVVTSRNKTERFDVPAAGCLYNAKLHHQISVRFPKRATDTDITCDIQIIPLNRENLAYLRQDYKADFGELVTASDFYEIRPSSRKEFKRPVTVKLPLSPLDDEKFATADVAVMQMTSEGWKLLDASLKFVKNSVSFDTRFLTRYCVALAGPQRKRRLGDAFRHIEREHQLTRGEVLPFLHLADKSWTIWVDCVPNNRVQETLDKRLKQGFKKINKSDLPIMQDSGKTSGEPILIRKSWRSRPAAKSVEEAKPDRPDLDLINGGGFKLEICGDTKISDDDDSGKANMELRYHSRLPDNYRRFYVEPVSDDVSRICTGFVKCFAMDATSGDRGACVRHFDFDVDAAHIRAFFYVEPESEMDDEAEAEAEPEPDVDLDKAETPPPPPSPKQTKAPKSDNATFVRLTTPLKPPRVIFKEPRVLTGKSLMCLAREVEQGLTLAIHLEISDSTITGMGFDALANGLSLTDITYRILLLWKRRTKHYKQRQVDLLAEAFDDMGRADLTAIIMERHKLNAEITPECFEVSAAD